MPPSATFLLPTCRYHATERNLQTEQARVPAIKSDVHSVWLVGTEVCWAIRTMAIRTMAYVLWLACYGYTYYGTEVWAIDQAATGSVQTYEVFSKCAAY